MTDHSPGKAGWLVVSTKPSRPRRAEESAEQREKRLRKRRERDRARRASQQNRDVYLQQRRGKRAAETEQQR